MSYRLFELSNINFASQLFIVIFFFCFIINDAGYCQQAESKGYIEIPEIFLITINSDFQQTTHLNKSLGLSNLSISKENIGSEEFKIYGAVLTNCPPGKCEISSDLLFQISSPDLSINTGSGSIDFILDGKIGNSRISRKKRKLNFIPKNPRGKLPWQADIEMIGKIDTKSKEVKLAPENHLGNISIKVYIF